MDWCERPESINVEDRRGSGNNGGETSDIIDVIVFLIGTCYGVDLSDSVGMADLGAGAVRQSSLT